MYNNPLIFSARSPLLPLTCRTSSCTAEATLGLGYVQFTLLIITPPKRPTRHVYTCSWQYLGFRVFSTEVVFARLLLLLDASGVHYDTALGGRLFSFFGGVSAADDPHARRPLRAPRNQGAQANLWGELWAYCLLCNLCSLVFLFLSGNVIEWSTLERIANM